MPGAPDRRDRATREVLVLALAGATLSLALLALPATVGPVDGAAGQTGEIGGPAGGTDGLAGGTGGLAGGTDGLAGGTGGPPALVDGRPLQVSATANLTATPSPAEPGETVRLDATGSTGPGGDSIVTCEFDVDGDGAFERSAQDCLADVTYETVGERTATVRVVTESGATATDSATVVVAENQPPRASIDLDPGDPAPGETVALSAANATDPDGAVVEFIWQVDGRTLTGETVQTRFGEAGEYEVTLLVRDDDGAENRTARTVAVRVDRTPRAALDVDPDAPTVGESVTLDAGASTHPAGTVVTYRWDIDGDGTVDRTTTGPETTVSFEEPGPVAVTVTVEDDAGRTDAATVEVVVGDGTDTATATATDGADGTVTDGGTPERAAPVDPGLVPGVPDALAVVLLALLVGGAGIAVRRREAVASRVDRLRDFLTRGDVRRRLARKVSGITSKNLAKRALRRLSDLIESGGEGVGEVVERLGRAIKRGSSRLAAWLRRLAS